MDARPPRGIEALKLRDVMDSLRKLIAKQRTEEDVLSLADVRGAALAILSHNGQFMFVSASAATLFGYSARDLLGKALVDFASDADRQLVLRGLSGSPADELRSFTVQLCGSGGSKRAVLVRQQRILGSAGRLSARLTVFEEPILFPPGRVNVPKHMNREPDRRDAYLMIGQETERKRVAMELHDGLGQSLTLIKLMVEDSLLRVRRGSIENAEELLGTTVLHIQEAIGDLRHICSELNPSLLEGRGLLAALVLLADRFHQSPASPVVTVDFRVAESDIPDRLKVDIFRIAQEGVHNAVKHAAATEIRLSVAPVEAGIMLTIADEGVGFDQLNPSDQHSSLSGLGLIGMQQRVESNGGHFSVCSSDGGGTLVSAIWEI